MPKPTPDRPATASDELPPHPLPDPKDDPIPEGTNETIHHPDDRAEREPARDDRKGRGPFVTGNW